MRLHYLQHVPFEGPANIEEWARKSGHQIAGTRLFAHESLPKCEAFDVLAVMGGPMGAADDHRLPWMRGEKRLIEEAIHQRKKVLGICLGAQMLADILGARVYPNPQKEIGWFPIDLDPAHARHTSLNVLPQKPMVFHWHADTFDLPKGALHLARSPVCENQAFAYEAYVIGLQFHLEMGLDHIETLIRYSSKDVLPGPFVMDPQDMMDLAPSLVPPLHASLFRFLDAFTS